LDRGAVSPQLTVTVLYFGALRDAAGRERELRQSSADSVRALWLACAEEHGLAKATATVRVAVNGEFAAWQRSLQQGDEVAFLPPFSGG
jgi:sulfur-carrier protein